MINKKTCGEIWDCYREIEVAEKLLKEVTEKVESEKDSFKEDKVIKDAFGRYTKNLQLGVPNGSSGQRLFYVDYNLAIPIIKSHINSRKTRLEVLNKLAKTEIED